MKRFAILVLAVMLTVGFNATAGANTAQINDDFDLVNGSFEKGLFGWTHSDNVSAEKSWAGVEPFDGEFQAVLSPLGFAPSKLSQDIVETDFLTVSFDYKLWAFAPFGSTEGDNLIVSLTGCNFVKEILNQNIKAEPSWSSESTGWLHFEEDIKLDKLKIENLALSFKLNNFQDTKQFTMAFIDNVVIDGSITNPVPIPTTLFLFGSGIAALAGIHFRRKNY